MMQAVGPMAQRRAAVDAADGSAALEAAYAARYCNYRKTSIYAGSNEIQRNIIAKRLLEL
jgi:alkylation response protein AidB-like acyl-CoA dehydrogenase